MTGGGFEYAGEFDPNERRAFEEAIDAAPHDATTHRVYADWLEEHGYPVEAQFRRSMGDWFDQHRATPVDLLWGSRHQGSLMGGGRDESDWVWANTINAGGGSAWFIRSNDSAGVPAGVGIYHMPYLGVDDLDHNTRDPAVASFDWFHNTYAWPDYRSMEQAFRNVFSGGATDTMPWNPDYSEPPDAEQDQAANPNQFDGYSAYASSGDYNTFGLGNLPNAPWSSSNRRGPWPAAQEIYDLTDDQIYELASRGIHPGHPNFAEAVGQVQNLDAPDEYARHSFPVNYMTTEDDFHRALDAQPDDHQTRMVFADWLDEQGDLRAAGYRALGMMRKIPHSSVSMHGPGDDWQYHNGTGTYGSAGLVADTHALPQDWINLLSSHENRHWDAVWPLPFHLSRRAAEDHAAHAFSQLHPDRQQEIMQQAMGQDESQQPEQYASTGGHWNPTASVPEPARSSTGALRGPYTVAKNVFDLSDAEMQTLINMGLYPSHPDWGDAVQRVQNLDVPDEYTRYDDERPFREQAKKEPQDWQNQLVWADFLQDRDHADSSFRRAVGESLKRRLDNPLEQPRTIAAQHTGTRFLGPDQPPSGPTHQFTTPLTSTTGGAWHMIAMPGLSSNDNHPERWMWMVPGLHSGIPGANPDGPGDPRFQKIADWYAERRARLHNEGVLHPNQSPASQWDDVDQLAPEERIYGGMEDLRNMDPALWPHLEALMRRQFNLGHEQLADDEQPTEYGADNDTVNAMLHELSQPHHGHTRWGTTDHPENAFHDRAVAADALQDNGRDQEAAWLRDPNQHVIIRDGQVYPGRFRTTPLIQALEDYSNHVSELTGQAVYPMDEVALELPGEDNHRDEDFNEPRTPLGHGELRVVHYDPQGYEPHGHVNVHRSQLGPYLANHFSSEIEGYVNWDDPDIDLVGFNNAEQALQNAPFEDIDETKMGGQPTQLSAYAYTVDPIYYMTTEEDFQRALDSKPHDHHTRLVFADWLQERGDPRASGYRALGTIRQHAIPVDGSRTYGEWTHPENDMMAGRSSLPRDWWELLKGSHSNSAWWHSYGGGRREAEDAAALAFTQLHPDRQAELLGQQSEPTQSSLYAAFNLCIQYADPLDPTEQASFETAIDDNPLDATNHLVYADWLQDRGHDDEAAFRRKLGEWLGQHQFSDFPSTGLTTGKHPNKSGLSIEWDRYDGRGNGTPWTIRGHYSSGSPGTTALPKEFRLVPHVHDAAYDPDSHGRVYGAVPFPEGEIIDPETAPEHVARWRPGVGYHGHGMHWPTYRGMEQGLRMAFMRNLQQQREFAERYPTNSAQSITPTYYDFGDTDVTESYADHIGLHYGEGDEQDVIPLMRAISPQAWRGDDQTGDMTPRLALADLMDERGRHREAAMLRDTARHLYVDFGNTINDAHELARTVHNPIHRPEGVERPDLFTRSYINELIEQGIYQQPYNWVGQDLVNQIHPDTMAAIMADAHHVRALHGSRPAFDYHGVDGYNLYRSRQSVSTQPGWQPAWLQAHQDLVNHPDERYRGGNAHMFRMHNAAQAAGPYELYTDPNGGNANIPTMHGTYEVDPTVPPIEEGTATEHRQRQQKPDEREQEQQYWYAYPMQPTYYADHADLPAMVRAIPLQSWRGWNHPDYNSPYDMTPRVVAADFFDELDRPEEAALLRDTTRHLYWDGQQVRDAVHLLNSNEIDRSDIAHMQAALRSTTDSSTDEGEPLDENYHYSSIHPNTRAAMMADWRHFQGMHWDDRQPVTGNDAYDFWLSRNGHGSGFFDRNDLYREDADRLQDASAAFGDYDLYIGADGMIYGHYGVPNPTQQQQEG